MICLAGTHPLQASPTVQTGFITVSANGATISNVLKQISQSTSYEFFYNNDALNVTEVVSVDLKDATLDEALEAVFGGKAVSYRLRGNQVTITEVRAKAQPQAQPRPTKVSGKVVSAEDGEPVIGVTVIVEGYPQTGTSTNIYGEFVLNNIPGDAKNVVFNYLGLRTLTLPIKEVMDVTMHPETESIQEIVVTGMGGNMDKRLFTGATDRLVMDDVRLDGLAEISRGLEGRSAGVTVQNVSGTFGAAPKIRVRGATSIYGSSKPLWVVDGVIMEDVVEIDSDDLSSGDAETLISSAIAGLNADDIESFQILKDGSATSIYGARAMAGVIVVTTKRGKAGAMSLNYSAELTTRLVPTYAEFNIMNSQQQMDVYKEMETKGWLNFGRVYRASNSGVYGKMYHLMNTYDPVTGTFLLQNNEVSKNAYLRNAEMRNTDWFKELFRMSVVQNHSVSISHGNERVTSYVSMSALVDPGWSVVSSVNRYTANLNSTFKLYDNLTLNVGARATYREQEAPGTLAQETDAVSGQVRRDFDINPYSYALNTSRTLDTKEFYTRMYAPFNILHELENNKIDVDMTDLNFQATLKWTPLKGLDIAVLGAIKYTHSAMQHHIMDNSNQAMAYRAMGDATIMNNNKLLYTDPDNPYDLPISILPQGGIYNRTDKWMKGYDLRPTINWSRIFNDTHIVNIFGAMEINAVDRYSSWFRGWGRQYESGDIPYYVYQVFKRGEEQGEDYFYVTNTRDRSVAFAGTGTYSYKGRYQLTGTYRYEGTNKLGKSRSARWLPTWNISAGWNAHEEDFFDALRPVLSHLNVRASYSLTADRGPSWVTNSLPVIKSSTKWRPHAGTREPGLYIDGIENSELTYEKKYELNIGADIGFLNNRINLVMDWYTRDNFDLIGRISVAGVGGSVDKYANVAAMKSSGVEFTLTTRNIDNRNFKWNTNLTFSHIRTEITRMKNYSRTIDLVNGYGFGREGYPHRSLFSIPFMGLSEDGLPLFLDQDGNISHTGVYMQEREKNDYLIYEGPSEPTTTGGFGNIFTYKGFRLNVFLTYSFGNKIRLDPVFSSSYSDLDAMPREFANRWSVTGDEAFTNIPVLASTWQNKQISNLGYAYNNYNYSSVRVADGGFVRLKEVSLSYDFPQKALTRIGISHLSLKLQGTNLALLYADKKLNGQDPEFFRSGGVSAPVPKQITLTLRLGF